MSVENLYGAQNKPPIHENVFRDSQERITMVAAYEKAVDILEKQSLKPEQFADTYSEALLERCASYVSEREQQFEKQNGEDPHLMRCELFGKTLEGILHDQINKGVFGESVRGASTARYDDYHAGVDEIIERQSPEGSAYIGCAIDATFGDPKFKVEDIVRDIQRGHLKDVVFYESPFGNPPHIHGKLQGIPRVVVGMDAENLVKLSRKWLDDGQKVMENDHLFLNILTQIRSQAEVYNIVATRAQQPEVAQRYQKIFDMSSRLLTERKQALGVTMLDQHATSDKVNVALRTQLSQLLSR